jgi:putative NIF3 family GTP cyclohydrolase 1 type 2
VATLATPRRAAEIADAIRPALGGGIVARSRAGSRLHERFAVCAGSGASLLEKAAAQGATLFLTGELSHHDVLRAHELGLELLLAGHTNTERGYLPRLRARLAGEPALSGVEFHIAAADVDPLA